MNLLAGKNLKVTYLFGAGASYQSVPIWKEQGKTMIQVANDMLSKFNHNQDYTEFKNEVNLIGFFSELKNFGDKAIEFGSIDIYAKRLYLIEDYYSLKRLKHCISVYFDLWENFYFSQSKVKGDTYYNQIDKRYFSLLSILLEKGNNGIPVLNENVNFITWNYDLQLENCLDSFLREKSTDYRCLNTIFNFFGNDTKIQKIVHLNGFRGVFDYQGEILENIEIRNTINEISYLHTLSNNLKEHRKINYQKSIKYAWESDSESFARAKEILKSTNILVIIGYSFPAFNRLIDSELIKAFSQSKSNVRVVYQDPYANEEILNILFEGVHKNYKTVLNATDQFYLPDELLTPIKDKNVVFNLDGI